MLLIWYGAQAAGATVTANSTAGNIMGGLTHVTFMPALGAHNLKQIGVGLATDPHTLKTIREGY